MPRRSVSARSVPRAVLLDEYAALLEGFAPGDYGEVHLDAGEERILVQNWLKRAATRRLNLTLVFLSGRQPQIRFRVLTPQEEAQHQAQIEQALSKRRMTLAAQSRRRELLDLDERQPAGIDALARSKPPAKQRGTRHPRQNTQARSTLLPNRSSQHRNSTSAPRNQAQQPDRNRKPRRRP